MESLPQPVDVVTVDVSFISLTLILPTMTRIGTSDADAVVLIKPQFEAGKGRVGKGGVVRDVEVHREVLTGVLAAAWAGGWDCRGLIQSPILGPAGNREFLAHLHPGAGDPVVHREMVEDVLATAQGAGAVS